MYSVCVCVCVRVLLLYDLKKFVLINLFLFGVRLLYNIVLVSAMHQ